MLSRNGTNGRVYGGDCSLVHIKDGERAAMGEAVANCLDSLMRFEASLNGTNDQGVLCPGCYMIALFNAAVELAKRNGQPLTELGNTMAQAFAKLASDPTSDVTEEINVLLDPEETAAA